jgi:cbb3-type cytochrome oxidase maturation protein
MEVVYLVLPLALLLAGIALGAFLWSVRRGQLDDLDTPPLRMLHDDISRALPRPRP